MLRSRGPYEVAGEENLMREHGVGVLLTKDSGGRYTEAKLDAASAASRVVALDALPS